MSAKDKLNLIQTLGLDNKNNAIDCRKTIDGNYLIVYKSSNPGITITGVGCWSSHVNKSAVKRRFNRFTLAEKKRIWQEAIKKGIQLDREFGLKI